MAMLNKLGLLWAHPLKCSRGRRLPKVADICAVISEAYARRDPRICAERSAILANICAARRSYVGVPRRPAVT